MITLNYRESGLKRSSVNQKYLWLFRRWAMERAEAVKKISLLVGKDLRKLANDYQVTVFINGKKNKGWAGHVIERYLGLPINCSQSPNFGSWELKTVSLKHLADKSITVKETMAITMIDPYNVVRTEFKDSHLLAKLKKTVIAARIWENCKSQGPPGQSAPLRF